MTNNTHAVFAAGLEDSHLIHHHLVKGTCHERKISTFLRRCLGALHCNNRSSDTAAPSAYSILYCRFDCCSLTEHVGLPRLHLQKFGLGCTGIPYTGMALFPSSVQSWILAWTLGRFSSVGQMSERKRTLRDSVRDDRG